MRWQTISIYGYFSNRHSLFSDQFTMLNNLLRNRVTEKDVRAWMDRNGFYGNSAEIEDLELHSLGRPGWLQIFSFQTRVKSREQSDQPWKEMFGAVKDDERRRGDKNTQVELFPTAQQQADKLQQWSEGLLVKSSQRDRSNGSVLLLIAAGVACASITLYLVNLFT